MRAALMRPSIRSSSATNGSRCVPTYAPSGGVVGERRRYLGVAVLLHEPPHCRETLVPRLRFLHLPLETDALQLLDARGSDSAGTPRLAPGLALQLRRIRLPLVIDPSAQRGVFSAKRNGTLA